VTTEQAAPEVLIVRHGQAHANVSRTILGPACTGLTEEGQAQAAAVASGLAELGNVTAIYASTTLRAAQTAQIIGDRLQLAVDYRPTLRVPDPGAVEGEVWAEARQRWPVDPDNPTRPLAPDSEPWAAYLERATVDLDYILESTRAGRVVIVGHTETVNAMYALLLGVRTLARLRVTLSPCEVSTWRAVPERQGAAYTAQRWSPCSDVVPLTA
jgi:broad specificity phosphatase PhoE